MTKTQLKVLWVGICILMLMGLFPPQPDGGYSFISEGGSLSHLCIEWAIMIMLTGSLIYTLKYVPDLLLRIAYRWINLVTIPKKPYEQFVKDAKEGKHNLTVFWVIVLLLLLLIPLILRLSNWDSGYVGYD